jgi:anti-sigma regulatory factor (Ser/Thr protein kinase)
MASGAPFRHEAMFYDGLSGLAESILPFLSDELSSGAIVLVMADPAQSAILRYRLGRRTSRLRFADSRALGSNPGRLMPQWIDFVDEAAHSGRPVVGVGALRYERTPAERLECEFHEALLNVAFANGTAWRLVCPYDLSQGPETSGEAGRTHPTIIDNGDVVPSRTFLGIGAAALTMNEPLPKPPARAWGLAFERPELPMVREQLRARLEASGLPRNRLDDLLLAAHEAATNCIRHGGGEGHARVWREDANIICEVAGNGLITDPLVGRRRPDPRRGSGLGLWIVNQVCDLVQLRSGPEGTVVRMHMSVAA